MIIEAVTLPLYLDIPKLDAPYEIYTGSCAHKIGNALFQNQEDGLCKKIRYWSRTLHSAERYYITTEQKFLDLYTRYKLADPTCM